MPFLILVALVEHAVPEIKICGFTRREDIEEAARLGVDYVGLVLAPSPRQVGVARAFDLAKEMGPAIRFVGVFVDPTLDDVRHAVEEIGLWGVQVHGRVPTGFEQLGSVSRWRGMRVLGAAFAERTPTDLAGWDVLLLDAFVEGAAGGTGRTFDWTAARDLVAPLRRQITLGLAGGLVPENVAEAMATLGPDIVDVSSGVEFAPGLKDHKRMREFVTAVRSSAPV